MYSLICKSIFLYSWGTDGRKHNSLSFLRKTCNKLVWGCTNPKISERATLHGKGKKKKKDAEDMSEPKVHTADSVHMDNSKLFPAEDGEVSGVFLLVKSIKGFFLEGKGLSASCNPPEDAKVEKFLLVLVVMKRVMVL